VRAPGPFVLCAALAVGSSLVAAAAGAAEPARAYVDRGQVVEVERLGPGAAVPGESPRTAVRLGYADGRSVAAEVDATAIVRLAPGAHLSADDEATLAVAGVRPLRALMPSAGLWLVEDVEGGDGVDVAARVHDATPNLWLRRRAKADPHTPTDPRWGGQWYFQNLGMPEAWGITLGTDTTTIVVVDTGCDLEHPDLVAKLDPGRDVVDGDDDPSFDPGDAGASHGTACAGLVGADTDNDEGIAGGCPACRVRCVRLLSESVPVPLSADVEAFQFALEVDAAVVSNSWGFVEPTPAPAALAAAIDEVATQGRGGLGAIVVFAAGNDDRELGDDEIEALPGVLCVGAVNNFDDSTPFTNRGASVDLVAPTGTLTTDIRGAAGSDETDYTGNFGGTSSACPVVAGIAGLLVSAAPERTAAELVDILMTTTRPAPYAQPDGEGHDPIYGFGVVDPVAALEAAMTPGPTTTAGAGGGAGEGGAGATSTGGGEGGDAAQEDDGGCGCEAPGQPARGAFASVLVALAGLLAARRRRR
jgi:serine protease